MKFSKQNPASIVNEAGILHMANTFYNGENPTWELFMWNLRHLFPKHKFRKFRGRIPIPEKRGILHYSTSREGGLYKACTLGIEIECGGTMRGPNQIHFHYNDTTRLFEVPDYYIRSVQFAEGVTINVSLNSREMPRVGIEVVDGRITALRGLNSLLGTMHPSVMNPPHYYSGGKIVFQEPFDLLKMGELSHDSREQRVNALLEQGLALVDVERWEFI
jgi:hypothetical protein